MKTGRHRKDAELILVQAKGNLVRAKRNDLVVCVNLEREKESPWKKKKTSVQSSKLKANEKMSECVNEVMRICVNASMGGCVEPVGAWMVSI